MANTSTEKLPRKVKTQMVKDKILATTKKLLKEKGFDYITVTNICKAAKVSVGSFYHHFDSKENLLSFYFWEAFEQQAGEFMAIQGNDFVKNLIRSYGLYNNFLVAQGFDFVNNFYTPHNKSIYSYNSTSRTQPELPIVNKNIMILNNALQNGYIITEHKVEEINSEITIIEKGCIFDWCLCDASYSLVENTGKILKTYLKGIASEKYMKDFPTTFT